MSSTGPVDTTTNGGTAGDPLDAAAETIDLAAEEAGQGQAAPAGETAAQEGPAYVDAPASRSAAAASPVPQESNAKLIVGLVGGGLLLLVLRRRRKHRKAAALAAAGTLRGKAAKQAAKA